MSSQKAADLIIYVGDSGKVISRLRSNHCHGNVEASALRKYVAEAIGYKIKAEKRTTSKSRRIRIDLPNPKEGETQVSNYIQSGKWRYVLCDSPQEAKDFQWYVIAQVKPLLNRDYRSWNPEEHERYERLLKKLLNSIAAPCSQLRGLKTGPGVYILYHQRKP